MYVAVNGCTVDNDIHGNPSTPYTIISFRMRSIFVLSAIFTIVLAGSMLQYWVTYVDCGTYTTECVNGLLNTGSSRATAYVTCNMDGYVSHYDVKRNEYAATKCAGDSSAITKYTYKTKKVADATNKSRQLFCVAYR